MKLKTLKNSLEMLQQVYDKEKTKSKALDEKNVEFREEMPKIKSEKHELIRISKVKSDELKILKAETEAVTIYQMQEEVKETLKAIEMKNEDLQRIKTETGKVKMSIIEMKKEISHLKIEETRSNDVFKCGNCDKSFENHDKLKVHMRVCHSRSKGIQCPQMIVFGEIN